FDRRPTGATLRQVLADRAGERRQAALLPALFDRMLGVAVPRHQLPPAVGVAVGDLLREHLVVGVDPEDKALAVRERTDLKLEMRVVLGPEPQSVHGTWVWGVGRLPLKGRLLEQLRECRRVIERDPASH